MIIERIYLPIINSEVRIVRTYLPFGEKLLEQNSIKIERENEEVEELSPLALSSYLPVKTLERELQEFLTKELSNSKKRKFRDYLRLIVYLLRFPESESMAYPIKKSTKVPRWILSSRTQNVNSGNFLFSAICSEHLINPLKFLKTTHFKKMRRHFKKIIY